MPRDPHRQSIDDRIRVQHMLDAARQIVDFARGRARADLDTDAMLARAIMHAIQEIGEAASRIGDSTRSRFSGVPWKQIVGMRHRTVHVYWGVNLDLVWEVVGRDIPPLIRALEEGTTDWPLPTP